MKDKNEINVFLVVISTILLISIIAGAKMLDYQEAMQLKMEQSDTP
jgi:hypothetical protein